MARVEKQKEKDLLAEFERICARQAAVVSNTITKRGRPRSRAHDGSGGAEVEATRAGRGSASASPSSALRAALPNLDLRAAGAQSAV